MTDEPDSEVATDESAAVGDHLDERAQQLRAEVDALPTIEVADFKKRSRRSFLTGAVGIGAAWAGWRWVQDQPTNDGIPQILRDGLEANESLWRTVSDSRMAPEFPVSKATPIQINGRIGIREPVELDGYTVRVEGPNGDTLDELPISHFEALPQRDMVIEHKCIEGWSSIVHWGGTRFSDFHERFADEVGDVEYVQLLTPDEQYYVGWYLDNMLHPQTMLALRQGTEPLDDAHGAPIRLATPNKYGIKTLKRIGTIRYTNERPADYWAERSYDWFAGL
ncbi:MAG: molybdopterin-dependent oxidoreductase [Actinomycetota bacterium]